MAKILKQIVYDSYLFAAASLFSVTIINVILKWSVQKLFWIPVTFFIIGIIAAILFLIVEFKNSRS